MEGTGWKETTMVKNSPEEKFPGRSGKSCPMLRLV